MTTYRPLTRYPIVRSPIVMPGRKTLILGHASKAAIAMALRDVPTYDFTYPSPATPAAKPPRSRM